jgi:hypothetical protein
MMRRPVAKNLINKLRAKELLSVLRTYFSNVCALSALMACGITAHGQTQAGPATALYRQISEVGLDAKQVYNIREGALDREDVHISLDEGTIAFTESVNGHITGALFEGEGTVLIVPPNQVERHSLGMFTKSAVLNQRFTAAYFRFDDLRFVHDLQPYLQPLEEGTAFAGKQNALAKTLAQTDALRLLVALTREPSSESGGSTEGEFIHARFVSAERQVFDIGWDTGATEQIAAGQISHNDRGAFYDQWMLFPMRSARERDADRAKKGLSNDEFYRDELQITSLALRSEVRPPTELSVDAMLNITALKGGNRTLLFELSRYLKLSSVTFESEGKTAPVEFIQNEALEGTQLAKRGNDVIAVVLPRPLAARDKFTLHFRYAGAVLSEAGGGLLYVGERGAWYPNRGPAMSRFILEFKAPVEWKLLATGKLQSREQKDGVETSRWASERDIPLAGFNLGKYTSSSEKTADGATEVTAFATEGVENAFPTAPAATVVTRARRGQPPPLQLGAPALVPAKNEKMVAEKSRDTIDFLEARIGPFPYSSLLLTQMPGTDSQGWPGLVYLSSHVFLTTEQRAQGRTGGYSMSPEELIYGHLMEAHETAHQWWGDAIFWQSYRDQWLMEALANYCALLEIESHSPENAKAIMEFYRHGLLTPAAGEKEPRKDAGPVTFGARLNSAPFPGAYDTVAYGRGTWLIHMLRQMLRDADSRPARGKNAKAAPMSKEGKDPDALFLSVLRNLQKKFAGKAMSTQDLQLALEEVWPESLRYEGKKSLDWFFDGWVNGTAIPKYELDDVKLVPSAARVSAHATLKQKDAPDSLVTSIPIYAQTQAGLVFVDRVFADGNETPIKLSAPLGTKKLVIDPYETVLRQK